MGRPEAPLVTRAQRAAACGLGLLVLAALLGPLLAADDPTAITDVVARRLVPPFGRDASGGWHLLGTDRFGRDILVRTLLAARVSLLVGLLGSVLAAVIGVCVGAGAAWLGGWVDRTLMSVADTFLAIPRLILLLLCVALWAPGFSTVIAVLAATGWMGIARLVRAEVLALRSAGFVEASRSLGAPSLRTLAAHVLPNATGPAVVATTLGVGNAVLMESGLAFLGLGVQPPAASWGNMIAGGRDLIVTAPWVALAPGLALILTVMLCTELGDGLSSPAASRGR
ncbi:MAG: ABC transporter permease [Gemmatimonadetes bacterium]|nr:ABC transporter permease [Gemmatimonadota bacterium]